MLAAFLERTTGSRFILIVVQFHEKIFFVKVHTSAVLSIFLEKFVKTKYNIIFAFFSFNR